MGILLDIYNSKEILHASKIVFQIFNLVLISANKKGPWTGNTK